MDSFCIKLLTQKVRAVYNSLLKYGQIRIYHILQYVTFAMLITLPVIGRSAYNGSKSIQRAADSLASFIQYMLVNHCRFGASTKNATDQHKADVVAFCIQCDVPLIFCPPNSILSLIPHRWVVVKFS